MTMSYNIRHTNDHLQQDYHLKYDPTIFLTMMTTYRMITSMTMTYYIRYTDDHRQYDYHHDHNLQYSSHRQPLTVWLPPWPWRTQMILTYSVTVTMAITYMICHIDDHLQRDYNLEYDLPYSSQRWLLTVWLPSWPWPTIFVTQMRTYSMIATMTMSYNFHNTDDHWQHD
jgi:hypothetical protein